MVLLATICSIIIIIVAVVATYKVLQRQHSRELEQLKKKIKLLEKQRNLLEECYQASIASRNRMVDMATKALTSFRINLGEPCPSWEAFIDWLKFKNQEDE